MRNIKQFLTPQTLSYLFYLPRVFFVLKNPVWFLKSYISGSRTIENIEMRNGLIYEISNFDDMGVFYEIFIKKEYGAIPKGNVTIVDIGANNGLFMLYCKSQNPESTIHCYEPVPQCASHIQHIVHRNKLQHVHIHEAAVSDKIGLHRLYLGSQTVAASLYEGIASWHDSIDIKTTTLPSILHDNSISSIDFLKVDCEGGEYDIFSTTSVEILERCKYMAIEYHDIDETKNGKALYHHIQKLLPHRKVVYHHHPAHPHNGFITVK